jgi:alpha-N-arabinofuranosidase
MEATGLVLQLYRHHFGQIPVEISGSYDPMDVSAALTADRARLTVGIINPTTSPQDVALTLAGKQLTGDGHRWVITGPGRFAHNHPGQPRQVDIHSEALGPVSSALSVPPLSVTIYELPLR